MATASHRGILLDESTACIAKLLQMLYALQAAFPTMLSAVKPSLLASIVACNHASVVRALIHNIELESNTIDHVISLFETRFAALENELALCTLSDTPASNDAAFAIACTLLAHDRMPLGRAMVTFLVTDGILSAPDAGTFDSAFASIAVTILFFS